MDNSKNYITILIDSLNKKIKLLEYILVENKRQQLSVSGEKMDEVQLSEKRNEQLVTKKFSDIRKDIHKSKNVSKVATDYYKTMSKIGVVEPQYLDKKK